jgi:hypothetical protein
MRYERLKEFTALLSILSAAITLGAALVAKVTFKSDLFPFIAGVAGALAATAAFISIFSSRRLASAREKKKVFLIYAREDLDAARKLAEALRDFGFQPWLDIDQIRPGEVWRKAVLRALEESAVALVLVSGHLAKKGFVQEEIKAALEMLQERQRDVSAVIPVRLTDAPVPEGLADLHWVNLFDADGLARLRDGLRNVAT